MSKPVIHVENLSKAYQIGQIGTGTISRDIERFWLTKILGKEDHFLKIGETNDRSIKGKSDIVWSLRDINFEINQGEAVGIIGKNGAGKSTLLKLLSRVTSPTTGQIKVKGRIASLLEVGTGFHPELSGRENIYLNGAILGMRKKEISIKKFITTPHIMGDVWKNTSIEINEKLSATIQELKVPNIHKRSFLNNSLNSASIIYSAAVLKRL